MISVSFFPLSNVSFSPFIYIKYALTFVLSLALALWATPLARNAALRYNIVDMPDGRLKDHKQPTPYLGGIVVYISFLLTLCFTFGFNEKVLGITLAGSVLVIIGLFDDMQAVTPGVKFIGQLVAILVLIKSGIQIEIIALPEWLNVPLTVLWIAGIINAVNIIDIMDGLAAGVAFCASLILFVVSVLNHETMIAVLTLALAGSLLGILKYNFQPAQIYLGDTGSMFIGLMLGSLSMIGSYSNQNDFGFIAPVLILGVPIFDMLFVMVLHFDVFREQRSFCAAVSQGRFFRETCCCDELCCYIDVRRERTLDYVRVSNHDTWDSCGTRVHNSIYCLEIKPDRDA
jgi:UDP-GlcNAc:undecaprenyl-phosphate GlcNAc-1-phosphate transferase